MKKKYLFLTAIALSAMTSVFLMSACAGTESHAQNQLSEQSPEMGNKAASAPPPSAITLSLCEYAVSPQDGTNGHTLAAARIRATSNTALTLPLSELSLTFLSSLQAALTSPSAPDAKGYVPALLVYPGLDGNNFMLLFQTCYLCTDNYQQEQTAVFYTSDVSATYSVCNNGSLQEYTDASARITEYKTNIKFLEPAGERSFDQNYDSRYAVVPLQKLIAVINANTGATKVRFHHFAVTLNNKTKQSLLCGPENISPIMFTKMLTDKFRAGKLVLSGSFNGNFANRSHLCPPRCADFEMVPCSDNTKNCQ